MMTSSQDTAAERLQFGVEPAKSEGPRAVRITLDFRDQASYLLDFSAAQFAKRLSTVQCVYVDNSLGTVPIEMVVDGTQQTMWAEPAQYGYYALLFGYPARLTVTSPGNGVVNIYALNVAVSGTWTRAGVMPVSGSVSVSNLPATQSVSGSVSVSNLPATQPVSGSVSVSNLPATQSVSGSVSVSNLPATQSVSGSVSVSNLPATQPVSGSVSVSNLPATQPVSGSVSVSGIVADSTLAAVIASGKVQTQDVSAEASLSALSALIANGALRVAYPAMIQSVRQTAAADTATAIDGTILCNASSGAYTETLPTSLTSQQTVILFFVKVDSSPNAVTVAGTVSGVLNPTLTQQWQSLMVQWSGSAWVNIGTNALGALASILAATNTWTGANSFNQPIAGTLGGWQTWTPTVGATQTMTVSGTSITDAQYLAIGPITYFKVFFNTTIASPGAGMAVTITLPMQCAGLPCNGGSAVIYVNQTSGYVPGFAYIPTSGGVGSILRVYYPLGGSYTAGLNLLYCEGFYRNA